MNPLWLIVAVLAVLVVWNQVERRRHDEQRSRVMHDPVRVHIRGQEQALEEGSAQPAHELRPSARRPLASSHALPKTTDAPPVPRPQPTAPRVETLHRCKSYGGSLFWSKTICHELRATIDRIATVPGSLTFEQQVDIAKGDAQVAEAWGQAPAPMPRSLQRAAAPKTAECAALEEKIRSIDAAARQPQPAWIQDSLKDQRQRARSRQAQLRC